MKIPSQILLFAWLLSSGCATPQERATYASAETFYNLLVKELGRYGTVESSGRGKSEGKYSIVRKFSCELLPDKFSPDQLYEAATAATDHWKGYSAYSSGGGENEFELEYGSKGTHVFIRVLAYSREGKTQVDVFIGSFDDLGQPK
jgi:hypothetical protein